jgi:DNA-binding transcriptional LysR family regulator
MRAPRCTCAGSVANGSAVCIGTSATVLMYVLPPILRRLKNEYPQLDITLKASLTRTTLQMLKANALDLGLCALPVHDAAFETTLLFKDELVAILPADLARGPQRGPYDAMRFAAWRNALRLLRPTGYGLAANPFRADMGRPLERERADAGKPGQRRECRPAQPRRRCGSDTAGWDPRKSRR